MQQRVIRSNTLIRITLFAIQFELICREGLLFGDSAVGILVVFQSAQRFVGFPEPHVPSQTQIDHILENQREVISAYSFLIMCDSSRLKRFNRKQDIFWENRKFNRGLSQSPVKTPPLTRLQRYLQTQTFTPPSQTEQPRSPVDKVLNCWLLYCLKLWRSVLLSGPDLLQPAVSDRLH